MVIVRRNAISPPAQGRLTLCAIQATIPMRVRILLLISLLISTASKGQDTSRLLGRWRVVVMDNGVKYDYKTETHTVSKALKDTLEKHKGGLFDLEDYINWARSCSECYFVFRRDGTYQDYRETNLRSEGTYAVRDSTIKILLKIGGKNVPKDYKYKFSGSRLVLRMPSIFMKQGINVELERAD